MELSWSTFLLEIINFLVLIWILKRFVYKPVLEAVARRRAGIENTLEEAATLRDEATALQAQYESRLSDWEKERQQAREKLAEELEADRARRLKKLQDELAEEREKLRVSEAARRGDALRRLEETAHSQGARFAGILLRQASGPETEARLFEMLLNGLAELPAERLAALRASYGKTPEVIEVASAFPLQEDQRQRLSRALETLTGQHIPVCFIEDEHLVAGLRITIGAWVLGANLEDELAGYAALGHER